MTRDPIVIVSAARTPMGNFGGYFKETPVTQLGSAVIQAVLQRSQVDPQQINEVIMGCVLPAGVGQAPARQAAILAGLPYHCGAVTLNKMCGSGMKSIMIAHDMIVAGTSNIMLAGGMENMSAAPYLLPKARFGYRLGHGQCLDHMMLDGLEDAYQAGKPMGYFAERCVTKYHFTREAQDEYAKTSVMRAKSAADNGAFTAEITPVVVHTRKGEQIVDKDEGPQTVDPNKISQLKPAFEKDGTVTAANSSSISDGASALLLMPHSLARQQNRSPLAVIKAHYTHSQAPEWFTTAPVGAIKGLLQKLQWKIEDIDLFEINEAFAVVAMVTMDQLQIPHEKVNIHGGACVLGHPIGASGARILTTLIYALKQKKLSRGIASLCIGGGEATAIAIEMC